MSFRSRMRTMVDSYEGEPPARLWEVREALLAKRSEIDRKLAAINRAIRNQRKASRQGGEHGKSAVVE